MAFVIDVEIPSYVRNAARRLGFEGTSGEVAGELAKLVKLSAPLTHPVMNRRYEGLAFLVGDGELLAVAGLAVDKRWYRDDVPVRLLCTDCMADEEYCDTCRGKGYMNISPLHLREDHLLYARTTQVT